MKDKITALPGLRKLDGVHFSGYASVNGSHCRVGTDESLFYWFAGSENYADRPTILWTNGGPGSSSFWGFFLENGPFEIGNGADWNPLAPGTVTARPMGWNTRANYLIFEHPLSVTLSKAINPQNIPSDVQEGIDQLYAALSNFLILHPEVQKNGLIIAGESYGGTYVPLLAKTILDANALGNTKINLTGQFIVSGWVNPLVQQGKDAEYAYTHGLISKEQMVECEKLYKACAIEIGKSSPSSPAAAKACAKMENYIREKSGRNYTTNILQEGDPSTTQVMTYLNREDVRTAIHAKSAKEVPIKAFFSNPIYENYQKGMQDSVAPVVEMLANGDPYGKGLQTMIVSGLDDGTDVNFLGVDAYIAELQGPVFEKYRANEPEPWTVSTKKQPLGSIQRGGNFSRVKVVGGGHLSVRDQPLLIDLIMEEFFPEG